jgi:hypothetical protein
LTYWRNTGNEAWQAAEKLEFSTAAPEGAIDSKALAVCLKAYPDTNREFFRKLLEQESEDRVSAPHES